MTMETRIFSLSNQSETLTSDAPLCSAARWLFFAGLLRIEGAGGFPNCNMGYTPQNWTDSEKKFHTFEAWLLAALVAGKRVKFDTPSHHPLWDFP